MNTGDLTGSAVGPWTIIEKLGSGGMGSVYKASSRRGKPIALKVLDPELAHDEEFVNRFLMEVATLSELKHPNIAQYFNADFEGDLFYYTMEYVDGRSLMDMLDHGHDFSEDEAAHIGIEVADVLDYAAKRNIIHRDIKPDNILIEHKTEEVKVLDLGLARYTHTALEKVTKGVRAIGTVDYMSPEQAMGLDDVDIRSDIYGLGATLFLLLTGSMPFEGDNDMNIMRRIVKEPPPRPGEINPRLSKEIDYIISKMMRHDRNRRYQKPREAMRDLIMFSEGALKISSTRKHKRESQGVLIHRLWPNKTVLEIIIIGWMVLLTLLILFILLLLLSR